MGWSRPSFLSPIYDNCLDLYFHPPIHAYVFLGGWKGSGYHYAKGDTWTPKASKITAPKSPNIAKPGPNPTYFLGFANTPRVQEPK